MVIDIQQAKSNYETLKNATKKIQEEWIYKLDHYPGRKDAWTRLRLQTKSLRDIMFLVLYSTGVRLNVAEHIIQKEILDSLFEQFNEINDDQLHIKSLILKIFTNLSASKVEEMKLDHSKRNSCDIDQNQQCQLLLFKSVRILKQFDQLDSVDKLSFALETLT